MRPTLYANDDIHSLRKKGGLDVLKRILPRRCPNCNNGVVHRGWISETLVGELHECDENECYQHGMCEGRGWLYPDPPHHWGGSIPNQWEPMWDTVWQMMRILNREEPSR